MYLRSIHFGAKDGGLVIEVSGLWLNATGFGEEDGNVVGTRVLLQRGVATGVVVDSATPFVCVETEKVDSVGTVAPTS